MTRDELAEFDDSVIETVAAEHDIAPAALTDLVRTHQSNVRDLPGVEDIVYEWRNYFHQDPLVGRTEAAYYLALPAHVWDEFAEDMGLSSAERAALLAVHERQARHADGAGVELDRLETDTALVLVRP